MAALIWILFASWWTAKVYFPRPDSSMDFSEMTGRRMMSAAVSDAHAYTSSIRARAGCSISTASALSRSTTLSESARMT